MNFNKTVNLEEDKGKVMIGAFDGGSIEVDRETIHLKGKFNMPLRVGECSPLDSLKNIERWDELMIVKASEIDLVKTREKQDAHFTRIKNLSVAAVST